MYCPSCCKHNCFICYPYFYWSPFKLIRGGKGGLSGPIWSRVHFFKMRVFLHPFYAAYLGHVARKDLPRRTLFQHIFHHLLWDCEAFSGQMDCAVPLACSGGAFHSVNVILRFPRSRLFLGESKEMRRQRQKWNMMCSISAAKCTERIKEAK